MPDAARTLVERCLNGNQAAMLEFVERFQGQVFGLCYRMLRHRHDAEDMAQETLVRALRNLAQWDSNRPIEPWLLAIAGNRCRTLLASRRNRPLPVELLPETPDRAPGFQRHHALAEEVSLALNGLRDEYRQAFQLFHEQELSYDEIGAALDRPLGTVKTWVHRARRELIERLRKRGVISKVRHALRTI